MYNIAIRADGGPSVGMGHVMRCLAVAEELKSQGCRVYFIGRYSPGLEKAEALGFGAFKLNFNNDSISNDSGFYYGNAAELKADLYETQKIMLDQRCDLILVDKYNLNSDYFDALKKIVGKVALIDDLNLYRCSSDIIVNGGINAVSMGYEQLFTEQKLLLGTKYIPLRKEFSNLAVLPQKKKYSSEDSSREKVESPQEGTSVMVTTGGADPYNCTGRILEVLLNDIRTAKLRYNVVITSGFIHKTKIKELADNNSNIKLYADPEYISEIMLSSDIAISSGGGTLYELCCCGTPAISFIMADNQKGSVEMLYKLGYIKLIGWFNDIERSNLPNFVEELLVDFNARKGLSEKMRNLVDGKGAKRIAQEIINTMSD